MTEPKSRLKTRTEPTEGEGPGATQKKQRGRKAAQKKARPAKGPDNPRTAYARGAKFERRVIAALTARGWCAIRSAGSRSLVDIIAVRWDRPAALVQCKTGARISAEKVAELVALAERTKCVAVLASRVERGTILFEALHVDGKRERIEP